jgi:hypothetical protein
MLKVLIPITRPFLWAGFLLYCRKLLTSKKLVMPNNKNKGFGDLQAMFPNGLFPQYTTTQRDALVSPAEGTVIYNITTHKLNVRVAAAWEAITSA